MISRPARSPRPVQGRSSRPRACGVIRLGFVLALAQLELPAVTISGDLHERRCPGGVADLFHAVPGVQGVIGPDVHHEPALGEPQVLHGHGHQFADRAGGSVAAQHEGPGERLRRLVTGEARAHLDLSRAREVLQPADVGPAAEVDQRVLLHPGQHELFQVGLVEHVRLREPVDAGLMLAAELGHHLVPGVEQPQPAAGPGPAQEAVADADLAEDPGHLVVQVDRAGQGVGPGVTFQQCDGFPDVGEQEGRGAADRARTDHDDTALPGAGHPGVAVLVLHGGLPLLGTGPGSAPVTVMRSRPARGASRSRWQVDAGSGSVSGAVLSSGRRSWRLPDHGVVLGAEVKLPVG